MTAVLAALLGLAVLSAGSRLIATHERHRLAASIAGLERELGLSLDPAEALRVPGWVSGRRALSNQAAAERWRIATAQASQRYQENLRDSWVSPR